MAEVGNIKFGADTQALKDAKQALDDVRTAGGRTALSANELIKLMAEQSRLTKALSNDTDRYRVKLGETAIAAQKLNVSTGQYNMALRQMPAQITDIVTQLQGGQNPFTILIQQGGQIKDSFGGIKNTLAAFAGMINPVTISAITFGVAVAGITAAVEASARSSAAYNKVIIQTGNASGTSSAQLEQMNERLVESGVRAGAAKESLLALTKAGINAGAGLEEAARAAAKFANLSGSPLEDIVKIYAKINDDPTSGLIAMAKNFNNVTAEQLAHIDSLQRAGKQTEALAAANEIASKSFEGMADRMRENLSPIQQMMFDITETASAMWAAITGAGQSDALSERIKNVTQSLSEAENANWLEKKFLGASPEQLRGQLAALSKAKQLQDDQNAAIAKEAQFRANNRSVEEQVLKLQEANMSKAEKRTAEAKRLNEQVKAGMLDAKLAAQYLAEFDKKNADKVNKPKKASTAGMSSAISQDVTVNADLLTMKARIEFAKQWTPLQEKMTREQVNYFDLTNKNLIIDRQLSAGKITLAQAEKARATASTISAARELANESSILQAIERRNAATEKAIKFEQQQAAVRSRYSTEYLSLNKREQDMRVQQERIKSDDSLTDEARMKMLESLNKTFDAQTEAHDNMIAGFESGMADYFDTSTNYFEQIYNVTGAVFQGMTDQIVSFTTTGKATMKGFVTSILADFARIATNKALSSLFQMGMSFFSPGAGAGASANNSFSGGAYNNLSFSGGGFTGNGDKYQEAGTVHKGEFVMDKESTSAIGVDRLYSMMRNRRSYADGGLVGGARNPSGGDINVGVQVNMGQQQDQNNARNKAVENAVAVTVDLAVRDGIRRELQPGGMIFTAQNTR